MKLAMLIAGLIGLCPFVHAQSMNDFVGNRDILVTDDGVKVVGHASQYTFDKDHAAAKDYSIRVDKAGNDEHLFEAQSHLIGSHMSAAVLSTHFRDGHVVSHTECLSSALGGFLGQNSGLQCLTATKEFCAGFFKDLDKKNLKSLQVKFAMCGALSAELGKMVNSTYRNLSKEGKAEYASEFKAIQKEQDRLVKSHLGRTLVRFHPREVNKFEGVVSVENSLEGMTSAMNTVASLQSLVEACETLGENPAASKEPTSYNPANATY